MSPARGEGGTCYPVGRRRSRCLRATGVVPEFAAERGLLGSLGGGRRNLLLRAELMFSSSSKPCVLRKGEVASRNLQGFLAGSASSACLSCSVLLGAKVGFASPALSLCFLALQYENPWTIPNILSMARMGLAPVLGYLIVEENFRVALGVFVLAGVTDLGTWCWWSNGGYRGSLTSPGWALSSQCLCI
uniref:Uncharacterized protein n=1 Tax=Accipiter nisus TaxID=211598 RepID=A0A8B9N3P8_9AVES